MLGLRFCGAPRPSLVPEGHTELSREQLKALYDLSLSLNGGKLLVHGIFARANTQNTNRRVYPKAVLKREVKCYKARHIKAGTALGELDHPSYSSQFFRHLNLPNVSHQVLSVKWRGDELWGTIEVLPTPSGLLLWELYSKGIRLGVSTRGWASLVPDPKSRAMVVDHDFELITFDFVTEPSTRGAFLVPVCCTYRKLVPQQTSVVQLSHMGVGSVAMDSVCHLPLPAALHARIRTLQKQQQACQLAIKAAATLSAPCQAAASSDSPGVLQPLLQHQQHLRPEAEGVLLLVSHYSTEQEAHMVQADSHGRNLATHLSTFAMKAHLADDTGSIAAHSSKGSAGRRSSKGGNGTSANHAAKDGHVIGVQVVAAQSSSTSSARHNAAMGKGSSKSHSVVCAAAAAELLVANALSRGSDGSASTSGSLRAATPAGISFEDGEHQPTRMPGCGLKAALQLQQRIQPQQQRPHDSLCPVIVASGPDDCNWRDGRHALQQHALQWQAQPPPPEPPPPPMPTLLQQQQRYSQQVRAMQQQQHQQDPSAQDERCCSVPGSCLPLDTAPQSAAGTCTSPDLGPAMRASCWHAAEAPPDTKQQQQQLGTPTMQGAMQQQRQQERQQQQQQQQKLQQPIVLSGRSSIMPACAHSSQSGADVGLLTCAQQQLKADAAGSMSFDACRVAVPVSAGCIGSTTGSTQESVDAMSCCDPEVVNIKHTIASYKAKCLAAQQAVNEALSSHAS